MDTGRRASAITEVMPGTLRLWRMTSVATKPVAPATMSFMIIILFGVGGLGATCGG